MEEPDAECGQNMCLGCDERCCSLLVELTTYDIARICLFERKKDFVVAALTKKNNPAAFRALGKSLRLAMKRKDKNCMFMDRSRELKCSINASKPSLCQIYPFELHEGEATIRNGTSCPEKNREKADHGEATVRSLEDYLWEWERYFSMVADWNRFARGDETIDEFLDFVLRETELETSALGSLYRKLRRPFIGFIRRR
jgi:Fe-S-cluster containining protein